MMLRCIPIATVAVLALFSWGCELSDAGCVSDSECRPGRFCVSGACTGEVNVGSTNGNTNGSTNNGTNISLNNISTNGDPGVCTDDTDCRGSEFCDPQSGACVPQCRSADDCEEISASVCSWRDQNPEQLACVAAEMCAFSGGFGEETSCGYIWQCPEGPRSLECRILDDGRELCTCVAPETGEPREFEVDGNFCLLSADEVADTVNVACGWRIPVGVDIAL
jgi:hypothetical protein